MRCRRRAAPGLAGRSRGQTAPTSEGWDESDFPIDGPAPDDLPVRDVAEEGEPYPTQDLEADFARTLAHDPVGAEAAVVEGSAEPEGAPSESAPSPRPNAASHHESAGNVAPGPQAPLKRAEPPTQPLLPTFELDDAAEGCARQVTHAPRPRDSTRMKTLKAAQIELWPNDSFSDSVD